MPASPPLLAPDEPDSVGIERPDGASDLVLLCDHGGRRIPRALGRLGLAEPEFERHIAWDIGALAVSQAVSAALDATLIHQRYSRLVIDCNRPLDADSSIPTISESTPVPGNRELGEPERAARVEAIFRPYHAAISTALDSRAEAGRQTIIVAMHSFTPIFKGMRRPWHIGTLYGPDARLARPLHSLLSAEPGLTVGDNEPYAVSEGSDYAIPVHGVARGLQHVGIEIRQDLIAAEPGQAEWAERLIRLLPPAAERALA